MTDPNGRQFIVRVKRVFWPGNGGSLEVMDGVTNGAVSDILGLLTTRVVWGVTVLGSPTRTGTRPLIYGEEWRNRDACLVRQP